LTHPIVTENLRKMYNSFVALDNLNLEVEGGVCLGFLGPNGAGKTTTIKILTNLIKPTGGKAYLNGIDVTSDPKAALSDVGAVVETPEFYPYLTPNEMLSYLGELRGMSGNEISERSRKVLDEVKLTEWADKPIGSFSRGMKQRIALAQALLHEPGILILDEPTNGLDPRGLHEVREIIKTLKEKGKTVLMSSHLLSEVQEVSDTVALLDRGRLIVVDKIENLSKISTVKKIEVRALVAPTDSQLDHIRRLTGVGSVKQTSSQVLVFEFEGDEDSMAELHNSLLGLGLKMSSFKPTGTDLEGMYLEIIAESVR
jgi:ABC-2 type transport system ATP-binding protein